MTGDLAIASNPEIREVNGEIDEFLANNASIHLEAMSNNTWWIGVDVPGVGSWHINLGAVNPAAKAYITVEEAN
ncbi:hypothetical protein [Rhodococcus sp. NPDC060176]|uniref:hypothetical protein n=1 Tax=Rhodococcus sp. NPDC060176 TaxID=3347062 RepID=UPI003666C612